MRSINFKKTISLVLGFLLYSVFSFGNTVQVSALNQTSNGITQRLVINTANQAVFGFEVKMTQADVLNRITINISQQIPQFAQQIKLCRSTDNIYSTNDAVLKTYNGWDQAINFQDLNQSVSANVSQYYFVVLDIGTPQSWFITNGNVVTVSLSGGNYLQCNSGTYGPSNFSGTGYKVSETAFDKSITINSVNNIQSNNLASAISHTGGSAAVFGFSIKAVGNYTINEIKPQSSSYAGNLFSSIKLYRSSDQVYSSDDLFLANGDGNAVFANLNEVFNAPSEAGETRYYFVVATAKNESSNTGSFNFSFATNADALIQSNPYTTYKPASLIQGNTYQITTAPVVNSINILSLNNIQTNNLATAIYYQTGNSAAVFGFAIKAIGNYSINQIKPQCTVNVNNHFATLKLYRSTDAVFSNDDVFVKDKDANGAFVGLNEVFNSTSENGQTNYYFLVATAKNEVGNTANFSFSFSSNIDALIQDSPQAAYRPSTTIQGNSYQIAKAPIINSISISSINSIQTNNLAVGVYQSGESAAVFGFAINAVGGYTINQVNPQSSAYPGNLFNTIKLYRSTDAVFSSDDLFLADGNANAVFMGLNEVFNNQTEEGLTRYYFIVVTSKENPQSPGTFKFSFATDANALIQTNPYNAYKPASNVEGNNYQITEGNYTKSISTTSLNNVTTNNVASSINLASSNVATFGFAIHAVGKYTINQINIATTVQMGNYFNNFALYRSTDAKFSADDQKLADGQSWTGYAHFEGFSESFTGTTSTAQTKYYFLVVTPKNNSDNTGDVQFSFSTNQSSPSLLQSSPHTVYNPSSFTGNIYNMVTFTWNGNVSTNWNNANNWTPTNIPVTSSNIIVPNVSRKPVLDMNRTYNSLTIATASAVDLNGQKLTLKRTLENNGNLLNSGSISNAALIFIGSGSHEIKGTAITQLDNLGINLSAITDTLSLNSPVELKGLVSFTFGVLNTKGKLLLKSTVSKDGAIGSLTQNVNDIIGEISVERYISSSDPSYRLVGSPVYSKEVSGKYYFSYKQYSTDMYLTGTSSSKNYPFTSAVNNLYVYNESLAGGQGLLNVSDLNADYQMGSGAYILAFGSKNEGDFATMGVNAYKNKTVYSAYTVKVTGKIFKGNLTVPVKATNTGSDATANYNDGFNLVSNPYAAPIDWLTVTKGQYVGETIYIYDVANKGFIAYHGVNNNISGGNIIRSGQAFFVKVAKSAGLNSVNNSSITFAESNKVSTIYNTGSALRIASVKNKTAVSQSSSTLATYPKQLVRLSLSNAQGVKDYMAVSFNEGAQGYDQLDDIKFGEGSIAIAALSNNMKISIAKEGDLVNAVAIPLYVKASANGTMAISSLEQGAFPPGTTLYLEDKYQDSRFIDLEMSPTYEFTVDINQSATYGSNRFVLHAVPPTTLPIALSNFDLKKGSQGVDVSWKTSSEKSADKFVVERSVDAKSFKAIGELKAIGQASNYSLTDLYPVKGMAYYRLAMYDQDGTVAYSEIRNIRFDLEDYQITAYPNPVIHQLQVKHPHTQHGYLEVTLQNLQGKVIFAQSWLADEGILTLDVNACPSGIYLLKVYDPTQKDNTVVQKIIKN